MISRASLENIHLVAPLFDLYRQFYSQPSDLESAQKFLYDRMTHQESVVFFAMEKEEVVGFVQLYSTYSSVSLKRIWILNDLFVLESFRGKGIGENLIQEAVKLANSTGAKGLVLETAAHNPARKLYERFGFKESEYKHYEFTC